MKHLGSAMQKDDCLLLGMDMIKDVSVLNKAYNDKKGVTARFNKNILNVVNTLAGTDFDLTCIEKYAFFNEKKNRIEMLLRVTRNETIHAGEGTKSFVLSKGETIHTENSYKFTIDDISTFGMWTGLDVKKILTNDNR